MLPTGCFGRSKRRDEPNGGTQGGVQYQVLRNINADSKKDIQGRAQSGKSSDGVRVRRVYTVEVQTHQF